MVKICLCFVILPVPITVMSPYEGWLKHCKYWQQIHTHPYQQTPNITYHYSTFTSLELYSRVWRYQQEMTRGTEKLTVIFLFLELIIDSMNITVGPIIEFLFITFVRSQSRVRFLWHLYLLKKSTKNLEVRSAGIALGFDAPIVEQLRSHMLHLVIKYSVLRGKN